MSVIDQLERRVVSLETLVEAREVGGADKGGPAERASLSSLRQHLDDLRQQLRQAKELREKEVVEFRLQGDNANDGTIPLHVLSDLASSFSGTLHSAARYLKKGTHGGPVPREIVDTLDLRLTGITAGSTRLYISGRTSPDLFGRSLIEESLKETFAVLQSDSVEELTDAVARVGASGARSISKMLDALSAEEFTVTLRWRSPAETELTWSADPQKLRELSASLEGYEALEPRIVEVRGTIITLSSRERFVIADDGGAEFPAVVPSENLELIRAFHVGQRALATMEQSVVRHRLMQTEKISYSLVNLQAF